jgi:DNA-directed RNA polymerase specialized sigma24 family protein
LESGSVSVDLAANSVAQPAPSLKELPRLGGSVAYMSLFAQLLERLPDEERTILNLVYLQGRSVAEIASLLGVPERAVAVVLERGRARIATLISQAGEGAR